MGSRKVFFTAGVTSCLVCCFVLLVSSRNNVRLLRDGSSESSFVVASFSNDSSSKQQDYPFFLVPETPDKLPTAMVERALVPKNTSLEATTAALPNATTAHTLTAFAANRTTSLSSSSCLVTSQVRIIVARGEPAARWLLQSIDVHGNDKTIGGDEYYVTYTDHSIASNSSSGSSSSTTTSSSSPTAVAFVRDCRNGSYALRFVTSPSSLESHHEINNHNIVSSTLQNHVTVNGTLTIYLQYSCGMGQLAPPNKDNWSTGGAINTRYIVTNMTLSRPPPMEHFVPPTKRRRGSSNRNKQVIDFGQYDKIIAYGDSTMGHFVQAAAAGRQHCKNLVWPLGNVGAPLTMHNLLHPRTNQRWGGVVPSMIDEITTLLVQEQQQQQQQVDDEEEEAVRSNTTATDKHGPPRGTARRLALLVNSGVWDILADEEATQGPTFGDHRRACRLLVETIRDRFPTVDLLWRSHTAMHIHRVTSTTQSSTSSSSSSNSTDESTTTSPSSSLLFNDWFHVDRVVYMSTSRSEALHRYQMNIMRSLNVTVVNLYPATYLSAEHLRPHDGRHYTLEFNRKMLNWFYPNNHNHDAK